MNERFFKVCTTALLGLWMALEPTSALAFGTLRYQVPNGFRQGCIVCHNNPRGGSGCSNDTLMPPRVAIPWTSMVVSGTTTPACPACTTTTDPGVAPCLNPFGLQFQIAVDTFTTGPERWASVAMMDADGDGWTNGEELGDPTGTWVADAMPVPPPGMSPPVTNDPTFFSHPGDTDATGLIDMCCITPNPDVDECAQSYDTCSDTGTASCDNVVARPGHSYMCSCATGYTGPSCDACATGYADGDGSGVCADVDECTAMTDDCDPNATCTNTDGSFTCMCNEHWDGSGTVCMDVLECAIITCGTHELCTEEIGAPSTCDCELGYARATPADPCTETCGDSVRGPSEDCDDGNTATGDGCSGTCETEAGFTCTGDVGQLSTCQATPDGGTDAGTPDGGTPGPDAGGGDTDGGATIDAGAGITGGGCSCRVGEPARSDAHWLIVLGLGLAWMRRRR